METESDDKELGQRRERKSKSEKKKKSSSSTAEPSNDQNFDDARTDDTKISVPRPAPKDDRIREERPSGGSNNRSSRSQLDRNDGLSNIPVNRGERDERVPIAEKPREKKSDRLKSKVDTSSENNISNIAPSSQRRNEDSKPQERVVRESISLSRQTKEQPSSPAQSLDKSKTKKVIEDGYDDDFENYDEDFEEFEEEEIKKPISKSSSNSKPQGNKKKSSDTPSAEVLQIQKLMALENQNALSRESSPLSRDTSSSSASNVESKKESKSLSKTRASPLESTTTNNNIATKSTNSTARRPKKFASMNLSTAGDLSADPRARRLAYLKTNKIFDLQEERINQLSIAPGTAIDLYHRLLRSQPATIRQIGVPQGEESRDVEVATEEIIMKDKEMQFNNGDDTTFLNVIRVINDRKLGKDKTPVASVMEQAHSNDTNNNNTNKSSHILTTNGVSESANNRLTPFLQRASQLCEFLLEENRMRSEESQSNRKSKSESIFASDMEWQLFGQEIADGSNEYIRTRPVVALRFSTIQPHVVITAHPYSDHPEDLKPYIGLYSIWDVAVVPSAPSWLLSGQGQPTCCCMSGAQTFLALAGTEDGVLHLWDLRESAAIHRDSDAVDLGVIKGVRSPSYSTPCSNITNSSSSSGGSGSQGRGEFDNKQHCHPIVQVEPLGSTQTVTDWTTVVSQFASVDSSGLVILWMTAAVGGDPQRKSDEESEIGLAPWSSVKLVRNRVLRLGTDPDNAISTVSTTGSSTRKASSALPSPGSSSSDKSIITYSTHPPVLSTIASDRSMLLVSSQYGKVSKLMRYGEAPPPQHYEITENARIELEFTVNNTKHTKQRELKVESYRADPTSISVSNTNVLPFFILVGRSNGSIDLFQSDCSSPIQSWNITALSKRRKTLSTKATENMSIALVRWVSQQVSTFIAVDELGSVYYFDLLANPDAPVLFDDLGPNFTELNANSIDISSCRAGSHTMYLAAGQLSGGLGGDTLRTRRIWDGLLQRPQTMAQEEAILRENMSTWIGRTVAPQVVQVLNIVHEG